MSNAANDRKPVAFSRKGLRALIAYGALSALAAGMLAWSAAGEQAETQAEAMARCERTAAAGGELLAIDPDRLRAGSGVTRAEIAALPDGYSKLSNGEGVLVSQGCAFVEAPE